MMIKRAKVSVIVPVYNCEKYLDACIKSIIAQTYENIELLLIDDGATDNSGEICDKYVKPSGENIPTEGREVKVFHRDNVGVSRTRNYGISEATGEYVVFVDSDDTIEPDMVEFLVDSVENNDCESAFCGTIYDYPDGRTRNFPEERVKVNLSGLGAIREILINKIAFAGPVCKIFRRDAIPTEFFPTDISIAEDAVALVGVLKGMKRVFVDTKPLYHYNRREGSLTTANFSKRDYDVIIAYERIEEMLAGCGLDREVSFRQFIAHFRVYDKYVLSERKLRKEEQYKWFKENFSSIIKNPYIGRNRKIALRAMMISPKLYRRIIKATAR
ncbi:glycosyltransferase [Eubacterium xylanophilum]|uniref:glycosyltransferase n=1 Tax=Eubacterium xylanophilum TaxID=39497 RepID=UPI00047876F1|nr:glycosyltransferase [Eubacterium xylanophilum]